MPRFQQVSDHGRRRNNFRWHGNRLVNGARRAFKPLTGAFLSVNAHWHTPSMRIDTPCQCAKVPPRETLSPTRGSQKSHRGRRDVPPREIAYSHRRQIALPRGQPLLGQTKVRIRLRRRRRIARLFLVASIDDKNAPEKRPRYMLRLGRGG